MSEDSSETLKALSSSLQRIEELLGLLPGESAKDMRKKLERVRSVVLDQRAPAFVLVGRRGAGKSSLINALYGSQVAEVGHVKAQTASGKWHTLEHARGNLTLLDTRGLQEGSTPEGAESKVSALDALLFEVRKQCPDVVLFLVKASEVDSAVDADIDALEAIAREVERHHKVKPRIIGVVTHCDVVEPKDVKLHLASPEGDLTAHADREEKLARIAACERILENKLKARPGLAASVEPVLGISSYLSFRSDGTLRSDERFRMDNLCESLFRALPDRGRGMFVRIARVRGLQEELATDITRTIAALCAGVAVVPIPVADLIPITSLQVSLITMVGWLSGRPMNMKAASEFLAGIGANVGAAFVFREGARALVKFVFPGAGSAISGVVAFAGTMAIGKAAQRYFFDRVSIEEAKATYARERASSDEAS
jgi:uncharacterized protein